MNLSKEDLILRFGKANIENLAELEDGSLDENLLKEMLINAKNIVASYVGKLDKPVFKNHILIIAYYFLEKDRATDKARLDYEDTLKFLEQIASKKIRLNENKENDITGNENLQLGAAIFLSDGQVFKRR